MRFLIFGDFSYDMENVPDDIRAIGEYARQREAGVILNLEGAISDGPLRPVRKRGKHLKQEGSCREALKELSVKGVTLANNHIMDFGKSALDDTLKTLDEMGIKHCGAGKDIAEALKPIEFGDDKDKTAVFSFGWYGEETVYASLYTPGCAPRKNGVILDTVSRYSDRHPDTRIIVVLHWGFEYDLYPEPYDIDLARRLCGIDNVWAVIGHHSHCPQPHEMCNGKSIFYSLGNFYYGKRRIKYSHRKFATDPENMNDYGLGVFLDTEDGRVSPLVVFYDREKDETVITEKDGFPMSMPEMDISSREYEELVRRNGLREHPFLLTNELKNDFIMRIGIIKRGFKRHTGGLIKKVMKWGSQSVKPNR